MRLHHHSSPLSATSKNPNKSALFHPLSAQKIGIKLAPLKPCGASYGASL
jgi:hypothetical protein